MKKYIKNLNAVLLVVAMTVSSIAPVSLAAPSEKNNTSANGEIVLSDNTESILEAAKAMASYNALFEEEAVEESEEKEAVADGIFHNHDDETDLSEYEITSKEMDEIVEEVLEENNMEATVDVTYETDEDDKVTTMTVEMDALVAQVGEEAAGLSEEQREELMSKYSQYMSFVQANADLFGVQTPYFTNKDNMCPIGSLLAIAGVPNEGLAYGIDAIVPNAMSFEEVTGVIDLFHYANVFAVELKKADILSAKEKALAAVADAKTDVQKHLQLTNWLAQWCTFDMPYIMGMQAPETDKESPMYIDKMTIYHAMYGEIKNKAYDGYYQYLVYMEGYPEETAAQVAEMMANSYMEDPAEGNNPNGAQSAMTLASSIINLWEGSHVGALTYKTAVCLGYSNAYVYLVQNLYKDVYKNADGTWKTYDQLNSGSEGNWEAIVDYVRITFDAEVTMFGVTQDNFQSDHYWNAVKIDGKWYYVDPCYVDVYVEVMARDRVETNGNVNHLYFMFSHDTAEQLYEGYYKELDTLYKGIATDRTYEDAWFAFAKSPVYRNENKYYYVYDSTDLIEMQNDYSISQDDIVYKLVSKNVGNSNAEDANADYTTELIDFTNGQVYNPSSRRMVSNSLIEKYYAEFVTYKEKYPSLVISAAYYNGKVYFNLSNCILSYDVSTGNVTRLVEYNTVTAERDMTVAFGGMGFTKSGSEGDYGITLQNPPIAGLTIRDGKMTVDIGTTLGYISGKKSHTDSDDEPEDTSSYGYMFEETNFNQDYLYASYSGLDGELGDLMGSMTEEDIDTDNDNDEFMWSANIYDTIDMAHLTGTHNAYTMVTVDETCTENAYEESKCAVCGLIQNGNSVNNSIVGRANHEYVRFRENYYTKEDNGEWKTAISYVCLHCKDVAEEKPAETVSVDTEQMSFVWTWAGDCSKASCYRIPTELEDIRLDCVWENSNVGSMRRAAESITKSMEGTCDEGVTYVYTAKAGAITGDKKLKQAPQQHQYVAEEIQFVWADDHSKCDVSYTCTFCKKAESSVCKGENIIIDYVEPTCLVDGKTIYTAVVNLEGNTYSNSEEIFNDNKALGHEYAYNETTDNELCIRCEQVKPDSAITLPESYRASYTGKAVKVLEKECTVEGSQADVTITYYTDKACTKQTTKSAHGASKNGEAPSKMGIYYAKANVDADAQYKAAESGVCKYILAPNSVTGLKDTNVIDGVKLTWKKVSEATGYEVYRRDPNGNYEKISTISDNSVLELIDEDVEAGKTYVYDVRSYAKTGTGTVRCEVNQKGVSIVHTLITLSNVKDGVSVKWTKVSDAKTYKIYRKAVSSEDKYKLLATVDASKTTYKDTTAKNGTKYYYYVSPDKSGTTNVGIRVYLNKLEAKSVTAPKAKQLKVSWNKNAKADGYRIRYSTSESFKTYTTVKVTSNSTLTKTITGLKKNTKYYVKVQAYKKSGGTTYYSAWSDVKSKNTLNK